jgi:hypothetical protein
MPTAAHLNKSTPQWGRAAIRRPPDFMLSGWLPRLGQPLIEVGASTRQAAA